MYPARAASRGGWCTALGAALVTPLIKPSVGWLTWGGRINKTGDGCRQVEAISLESERWNDWYLAQTTLE